jgi:hypothetical protein
MYMYAVRITYDVNKFAGIRASEFCFKHTMFKRF